MARQPQEAWWERLQAQLQEQDVIIEAQRDTEQQLRERAAAVLGALETVSQDARRIDESLSQCEQEERLKRQRAQGFCRRTIQLLDSRVQDALVHSSALAQTVTRLAPAEAEWARSDGALLQQVADNIRGVAQSLEGASLELHRSLVTRCGENMDIVDSVVSAHKDSVASLVKQWNAVRDESNATAEELATQARLAAQGAQTWGDEALARLEASGSVVDSAHKAHTTAVTAAHAAMDETLSHLGQLLVEHNEGVSAVTTVLTEHVGAIRDQSDFGEAGHISQLLQAQRTHIDAVVSSVRSIGREAVTHTEGLGQCAADSASATTRALELVQEQRHTVQQLVDGQQELCAAARATLNIQSREVEALGLADSTGCAARLAHVAEISDAMRNACTQLRDSKLINQHTANLSAAQKQQDESSTMQLDMLGALSSGLEAAITMDLGANTAAGSGEALVEDEVLAAVNQASKQVENETAAVLESLKQQAQQLHVASQHLDVLTVTTREARQREATTNMLADIQSAHKRAQHGAVAAVVAGMDTLLKEQLTKMSESVEQKTKQAIQEHLDKLVREQQAELTALQHAQREAVEMSSVIQTDLSTMKASQTSHGKTICGRTTKLGSRVRNAVKKLGLLLEEIAAIEEHAQSSHTAALSSTEGLLNETAQRSAMTSTVASDIEAAATVLEKLREEVTSAGRSYSEQVKTLGEHGRNNTTNIEKLDADVQMSAKRVLGTIEALDNHVVHTASDATQLYESLQRQASEWMASLPALEQSTAVMLDDNGKIAEADTDRLENLLASGTAALSSMADLQANDAVSTCLSNLEEQNTSVKHGTEESARRYASRVADALQAEVEQVQARLAPNHLHKVDELQRVLSEHLNAGADAAFNTAAETDRVVSACTLSTRAWDQYRVSHKQHCDDMQTRSAALETVVSECMQHQIQHNSGSGNARLETARDIVESIHQYAEKERTDAQSLVAQVSDFCIQDLQMDELVVAHTAMVKLPQFSRELPKTPAEDDLLANLRARRARAMAESAADTAVDHAERLGHQAAELEQRMAVAEDRAFQAAASSRAAALNAARSAKKSAQAADRAASVSPPNVNLDPPPSVPAPPAIEKLHSTMSPGSGTHVPAPVELFGTLRAHSPPSTQPGQTHSHGRLSVGRRASVELDNEISPSVQRELDEQHRQHEQQMRIHQEQLERIRRGSGSMEVSHANAAIKHSRGEPQSRTGPSAGGNINGTASAADILFDTLDTNGDGIITRADFTSGLQQTSGESDVSPNSPPPLRRSEITGIREVDAERQRLRAEIAAAADTAEAAMRQSKPNSSPHVHYRADFGHQDAAFDRQMHAHMPARHTPTQPTLPVHYSWLSDGAQPWVDQSATYARGQGGGGLHLHGSAQKHPHSNATADPVAAALLRVCWEAIHYRRRTLWGRPINSLMSFYSALQSQPSVVSTRLGPQLRDIREGLRHLDIGLTDAQLDRLIATINLDDQQGGVSFDCFSRWLHVHSSDASIIEAANVATMPGAGRSPAANALSSLSSDVRPTAAQLQAIAQMQLQDQQSHDDANPTRSTAKSKQRGTHSAAAAQMAADRQRSRSPTARSKSGRHGVEPTSGPPGAWTRLQSDDHEHRQLTAAVQQELQRVLWHAVHFKKRTLCVCVPCLWCHLVHTRSARGQHRLLIPAHTQRARAWLQVRPQDQLFDAVLQGHRQGSIW